MSRVQANSGKIFHKLLRDCLSEERRPTAEEVELIAGEIWRSSHGCISGQSWSDVQSGSDAHRQMINASNAALGSHRHQLDASNDGDRSLSAVSAA